MFLRVNKRLLLSTFNILLVYSCKNGLEIKNTNHIHVIGIDGALASASQIADTPNINSLNANGAFTWNAYSGGELHKETKQTTSSGSVWSNILTGVWVNKHGVEDNIFTSPNFLKCPHFFRRIKEKYP
ncbi:MAG: hypothetical protein L6422_10200, partial [Candidatus Marinimicrobia bacterium]|nr:hypothetical protein [bacterium]MCG2716625.1 hypothetical protein [Candidatus Neomarinimicrobiota bacterium]